MYEWIKRNIRLLIPIICFQHAGSLILRPLSVITEEKYNEYVIVGNDEFGITTVEACLFRSSIIVEAKKLPVSALYGYIGNLTSSGVCPLIGIAPTAKYVNFESVRSIVLASQLTANPKLKIIF